MAEIKSPLAELKNTLIQVREAARVYSRALQNNEAATRAVLIDPLLRALGWDTGNPFMVEVESKISQSRFDYALQDMNAETQIIVEAKSVGTDLTLEETFMSLVKYAFASKLENVFLTDGVHWHHFTQFKPGISEPETKLSIEADDLVDVANYFIQHLDAARYWEEDSIDQVTQEVRQLRGELNALKTAQLTELGPLAKYESGGAAETKIDLQPGFTPLAELTNLKFTKPKNFRLPDNKIVEVSSWTDVLVQSCDYVFQTTDNLQIPIADKAGKKIQLISLVQPPLGISYYERTYLGRQVYIYTNYDSITCVKNSIHILSKSKSVKTVEPAIQLS
jgi:hypothetical protein